MLGVMFNVIKVPQLLHRTGSPRRSRTHKSFTTSVCNGQSTKKRKKPRASLYLSIHPSIYLLTILAKIMWDTLTECTASTIHQFFTWKKKRSIYLSDCPSVRPAVCLSVFLSVSVYLYICLSAYLSIYLSIYFVYLLSLDVLT